MKKPKSCITLHGKTWRAFENTRKMYKTRLLHFSSVLLSQCNTRLRLLHLLYDLKVTWWKTRKRAFLCFVIWLNIGFDQSVCAQALLCIIYYKIISQLSYFISKDFLARCIAFSRFGCYMRYYSYAMRRHTWRSSLRDWSGRSSRLRRRFYSHYLVKKEVKLQNLKFFSRCINSAPV